MDRAIKLTLNYGYYYRLRCTSYLVFLQSVFFRLSAGLNAGAFGYFWLKIVGRKAELMPLLA
jgi:hypothetical protein